MFLLASGETNCSDGRQELRARCVGRVCVVVCLGLDGWRCAESAVDVLNPSERWSVGGSGAGLAGVLEQGGMCSDGDLLGVKASRKWSGHGFGGEDAQRRGAGSEP